ncbi:MAG: 2,3-bisphosphoglycerate-independent phosphoglycerate mutase [Chloroflexi bacterium]|nr:2,3-bisphosphoglycerate-independent phosphoglycerate mutase [Chloroflexota bacterium]
MITLEQVQEISLSTPSRMVMLVIDGLGGLPHPQTGKTELETAHTPHLDQLAWKGTIGLTDPVFSGITPGSAPGHLGLFGYDPLRFVIGRGVLEAVGINFPVGPGDLCARGNFCTVDKKGLIVDRRAGRLPTSDNARLCQLLSEIKLAGAQVFVEPVKDHRFALVLRGKALSDKLADSDPQREGVAPPAVNPLSPEAAKTAALVNSFVDQARSILANHQPANMLTLRGFSHLPQIPSMQQVYKLKPAAIAVYPMYRGLASLVGMTILPTGGTMEREFSTLKRYFKKYDFFFIHIKGADSAGEDGDFDRKVKVLEAVDAQVPQLIALQPDVIVVCGDHSTPATLKSHSWHPVPLLLYSRYCRPDGMNKFSETNCARGGLGHIPATAVMPLAMANALKLVKFGA